MQNKSVIVHKFAQKYRFKGLWDTAGKIFKEAILNSEIWYEQCTHAFECYTKMKQHLSRNVEENSTHKVLDYEVQQDDQVVQNEPFRYHCTYIGLDIESFGEYDTLKEHKEHMVFIDRNNIEDMIVVNETMKRKI